MESIPIKKIVDELKHLTDEQMKIEYEIIHKYYTESEKIIRKKIF